LAAQKIVGWEDGDQYQLLLAGNLKIYRPEWRETVPLYAGATSRKRPTGAA
jgi:hypothetical protein